MCERVIPDIPKIKAHWERRSDPMPYLMVPMSDGSTLRFNAEIKHPGYVKAIQNIQNMKTGYQNGGGILPGQMTIDDVIRRENDESTV